MTEEKTNVAAEEQKDEQKKDAEVPAKFKSIIEEIEKMSVLDLSELVAILEEKFNVSAQAPVVMGAAAPAAGVGDAAPEEKSAFDIELTAVGDSKIAVIKAVKEIAGTDLKGAKDIVDSAPKVIKQDIKKAEAEEIKATLSAAGATVTLK